MKLFRIFKRFRLGINLKIRKDRVPPSNPPTPPRDNERHEQLIPAKRHDRFDDAPVDGFNVGGCEENDFDEVPDEQLKRGFLMENKAEVGNQPRLPATILLEILMMSNAHTSIMDRRTSVQPHLSTLVLVCKTWCFFVLPMLHREVYLSSPTALESFASVLKTYSCLRKEVRYFQYYGMWFKSGRVEMSPSEIRNLEQVYSLCTNLSSYSIQRPLDKPLCCDGLPVKAVNLNASNLKKLTRLEIGLSEDMPCKSILVFSERLVLPALQELIVDVQRREWDAEPGKERTLEWPIMPRLAKLCIRNWHVSRHHFSLPLRSGNLRIVELLGGSYMNVDDLFGSELRRYAKTLESITITAADVGDVSHHEVDLEDFASLTEICVPIYPFAITTKFRFPRSLRCLVVSGSPETAFQEPWRYTMEFLERNLTEFLECDAGNLVQLESVRVMLDSPWMTYLQPIINFARAIKLAKARGVKLEFGFTRNVESE